MDLRPPIKRTYSRIKKEDVSPFQVSLELEKENEDMHVSPPADVARSLKKTKITDFFRKKTDPDSSFDMSPLAKLKIASSPAASSLPESAVKAAPRQTFLDLGQKDLVSTQCPECLMHYNRSFSEDQALHKRFHARYLKGFQYNPEDGIAQEIAPNADRLDVWKRYRFFSGGDAVLKKLDFFLQFVSIQLGAEALEFNEIRGKHTLVFAIDSRNNEIAACVLFEPIKRAYLSRKGCSEANIEIEPEEHAAVWGVSRIWTGEKHRKRGLASLLLDLKASKRSEIAFSQPTPLGFSFAKSYQSALFGGDQCLIYASSN